MISTEAEEWGLSDDYHFATTVPQLEPRDRDSDSQLKSQRKQEESKYPPATYLRNHHNDSRLPHDHRGSYGGPWNYYEGSESGEEEYQASILPPDIHGSMGREVAEDNNQPPLLTRDGAPVRRSTRTAGLHDQTMATKRASLDVAILEKE